MKNLKNLYWFCYVYAPANVNSSGIAIIVENVYFLISRSHDKRQINTLNYNDCATVKYKIFSAITDTQDRKKPMKTT